MHPAVNQYNAIQAKWGSSTEEVYSQRFVTMGWHDDDYEIEAGSVTSLPVHNKSFCQRVWSVGNYNYG